MVKCGDSSIIQEWYSIHANTTKVNDLFIWNPNFGTFVKLTNLGFYERRNSLDGIGLRVSTKNYLNFTRISDDILKVLSQAANFKIQIQPYQKSGGKLKQDMRSWSGVIGQIQKNQADIGLTSFGLTITPARLDVVDFSKVFLISRSKFYIKKFSKTRSMPSMYYKAIGIEAVYWLLIVLAGSPIVLTVIIAKQNQMSYRRILYDNYLYVWRIFCINPPPEPCRNLSTKVACLSLLFSAYVLYSVYSTLLVSYLAVLKPDMPFHSLEEFIDAKTHQIMSLKNNSLNEALEVSNDELMKTLRNFFVNSSNKSDTFQERSKQICESEEKLILFADDIVFTNSDIDYPCELISFGNGLRNNKGFALVKGTPYKGLIDHYMQKMQDSGVLDALLRRYYKSPKMDANGYKAVNLQCTWPIFGVLGIGISLSFFIFVCEKFLGTISPRDTGWVD